MLKIKPHLEKFGFNKGSKMSLTVETKVWEKDWRFILKQGFLKQVMLGVGRAATKRLLLINNVDSPTSVARYADQLIKDGVLDNYVFVDDYAAAALEFFDLRKSDLGKGYYYSIAELVSIYLCDLSIYKAPQHSDRHGNHDEMLCLSSYLFIYLCDLSIYRDP